MTKAEKMFRSHPKRKAGSSAGSESLGYYPSHNYSKKKEAPPPKQKKSKKEAA